jgi:hypothetical protein
MVPNLSAIPADAARTKSPRASCRIVVVAVVALPVVALAVVDCLCLAYWFREYHHFTIQGTHLPFGWQEKYD